MSLDRDQDQPSPFLEPGKRGSEDIILILALVASAATLAPERREKLEAASAEAVRGAWLLELHGDTGNLDRTQEAWKIFQAGVDEVLKIIPQRGPK